jgi:hypothetical protein
MFARVEGVHVNPWRPGQRSVKELHEVEVKKTLNEDQEDDDERYE